MIMPKEQELSIWRYSSYSFRVICINGRSQISRCRPGVVALPQLPSLRTNTKPRISLSPLQHRSKNKFYPH